LAARGGLGATAGQHLQWSVGETLNVGSLTHVNVTGEEKLRAHAGQIISLLAGAENPDHGETALQVTAAKEAIEIEAQHDELKALASGSIKLASVEEHIDFAARKKIHIATAQGASITIEGGNITFECPGKITIYRTALTVKGPRTVPYGLPQFPISNLKPKNIFPFSR
jgi:uncharacterized protein (DUF2345 family)